jgi:hypothetical protein
VSADIDDHVALGGMVLWNSGEKHLVVKIISDHCFIGAVLSIRNLKSAN